MKTTCLFWNLYKSQKALPPLVEIVKENNVDIVFLCEFPFSFEQHLESELKEINTDFHLVNHFKLNTKFRVYSTYSNDILHIVREEEKFSVFELKSKCDILMCVVHLSSLLHANELDKLSENINFSTNLQRLERETGNSNLIVLGDFNEDPYNDGMLICNGLNAVKEIKLAQKIKRTRDNHDYPFFYNPMWALWESNKDIGTYYYYPNHVKSEAWHIFDQGMIDVTKFFFAHI